MLGLHCCVRAFLYCREQGLVSSGGARASHCSAFSCWKAWAVGCTGFSSCSSRALEHRLNSCGSRDLLLRGTWYLPGSGIDFLSPALAGGFFTTEPPGKPQAVAFKVCKSMQPCGPTITNTADLQTRSQCVPGWKFAKIRASREWIISFWGGTNKLWWGPGRAEGGCLPTYILCERLCSLYMETHLQPVPQVEAPGQGNEPFSQADWSGFNLLSMQCPGGRSLTELSLWLLQFEGEGRNANPSGHKDQAIKGPPWMDCAHSPALVMQVKNTGGRAHPCL